MKKYTSFITEKIKNGSIKIWMMCGCIFLLGAFFAFAARFVLVPKDAVHYHADFAVFINGQREQFKSFVYYEEEIACSSTNLNDPKTRVHMHDQIGHIVHIHDYGVTWGHFFANLGYTLGDNVLAAPSGVYVNGQNDQQLRFILNGKPINLVANRVIGSEDRLLIDVSNDTADALIKRYNTVENDAHKYNIERDPATCSGGENETFTARLKRTIGVSQD